MPAPSDVAASATTPPAPERGRRPGRRWLHDVAFAQQKSLGIATTAVSLLVIGRLTLKPLGGALPAHFETCVLCGSHGLADFLLNVLLFVPLGLGLRLAGLRRRAAWAAALALTVTIEVLQFYVVTGRESDLSDIVSNTLGGVLGVALADVRSTLLVPAPVRAAQLAVAGALVAALGEAVTQVVLAVSLPHSIYYEQVAPDLGHLGVFGGTVVDATFNGQPFHPGRLTPEASARMRAELLAGRARIETRVVPGPPGPHLAPIVSVFDQRRREIFLLGRRRDDLVFRVRRRSDALGFHPPSLVLAHALPPGGAAGDTVAIGAAVTAGAATIEIASRAGRAARRIDTGVWQAWRLLVPDDTWYGDLAAPLTVVWVAAMFAPLGYWGGRAAVGEGALSAVTPALVALIASLAIIPWAAAAPVAPAAVWVVATAAVGLGWACAAWTGE